MGEIVTAYVGLLCTGKSDFDAIENHRQDGFFAEALGLSAVPAASTLRMQLDAQAEGLLPLADELSVALLKNAAAPITALACALVPLDIDVFTQDNGRTRKEGVSRTYAGTDGYALESRGISARKAGAWRWSCARAATCPRARRNTPWNVRCLAPRR